MGCTLIKGSGQWAIVDFINIKCHSPINVPVKSNHSISGLFVDFYHIGIARRNFRKLFSRIGDATVSGWNDRFSGKAEKIMRTVLRNIILALLLTALAIPAWAEEIPCKIDVFFWHDSPNDEMAYEGIRDGFRTARMACAFRVLRAEGDSAKADEMIAAIAGKDVDLVYAMGTEATKRLMKVIEDKPIVFTAVTNPVQSGITPNWQTSGRNIAGNSNWIPTGYILKDFKQVVPGLKQLGVAFNPDNSVSSVEVRVGREKASGLGLELVEEEIHAVADLVPAVRSLLNKGVQAIWVPIDILVYKNVGKIRQMADPVGIPILASSHRGIKQGAVYGETVDYHNLGMQSVAIALKILVQRISPKEIPVGTINVHQYIVNLKAAQEIGYQIPLPVLATADEIIE